MPKQLTPAVGYVRMSKTPIHRVSLTPARGSFGGFSGVLGNGGSGENPYKTRGFRPHAPPGESYL